MMDPDVFMMSSKTWDAVREIVDGSSMIKTKVTAAGQLFGGVEVFLDDDIPFNETRQLPKSQAIMILQAKRKEGLN